MSLIAEQLRWIESQGPAMLDRVIDLARINSGSDHPEGLARCAKAVAAQLEHIGLTPQLQELSLRPTVDQHGQIRRRPVGPAVLAQHRPQSSRRVLLNIHYDTVYGPDSAFQDVTRPNADTLIGPGVTDAKGGIVVLL